MFDLVHQKVPGGDGGTQIVDSIIVGGDMFADLCRYGSKEARMSSGLVEGDPFLLIGAEGVTGTTKIEAGVANAQRCAAARSMD